MSTTPVPPRPVARVHEQGYRRYDGLRQGTRASIRAVVVHTVGFILGYRRRARSKLLPFGLVAVAVLPALGFTAALLVIPAFAAEVAQEVLPGPEVYLGGTILLTYLAAAIAGPAALCGDRNHGMIALYLASPLTRDTYLLGKAGAVMGYLSTITVVPSMVYVLGIRLAGVGDTATSALLADLFQVTVAGTALAISYGALSMAAASVADRQGAASALVIGTAMISGIVVNAVVGGFGFDDQFLVLDLNATFLALVLHVHGEGDIPLSAGTAVVGWLAWTGLLLGIVRWRYAKLQVTR